MLATDRAARTISFDALKQPLSPLFRDYFASRGKASDFYPLGFSREDMARAAATTAAFAHPRREVAEALAREQPEGSRARKNAEALQDPKTLAVVTGQQAVLFGGPLYVLYKALAAMELARHMSESLKTTVVPVFWVASDDHDFAEIRATTHMDGNSELKTLRYEPAVEPNLQPASTIILDRTIDPLAKSVRDLLPASPWRDEVCDAMVAAYQPGDSISGAFSKLLQHFLPGLVIMDPAVPALKKLMRPVIDREIAELSPTSRLAAGIGEKLLAAGYHQQVPVRASGFLNLFLVTGGKRRALGVSERGVEVRGGNQVMSKEELLARIAASPEDASPGVMLRPLVQDYLLPTIAYIGGPAEVAYHAQIGPSYAHFGVPRPVIFPRPSFSLVDAATARAMEAEGLSFEELQTDTETLLARAAREANPEVGRSFADSRAAVEAAFGGVEATLAKLDPTLRGAVQSALGRALHQMEGLQEKALRTMKRQDATRAERMRRTRDFIFPGGALQERGVSWISLLAKYGPPIIDDIRRHMDPWAKGHQVLPI
ncbi:MAG TPA: bacillithiol biosynthesis cysteine-adding enzyme BshC [Vicinamibacteria bacterium]|nr:bacillithiol biosynthesis cysteine-adding enzyme BshC [Vicinamibacteria bacterium]